MREQEKHKHATGSGFRKGSRASGEVAGSRAWKQGRRLETNGGEGSYLEVTPVKFKEPREGELGIGHAGHEALVKSETHKEIWSGGRAVCDPRTTVSLKATNALTGGNSPKRGAWWQ